MKIRFVRVWHDHCMKRMPCPWTVQVQLEDRIQTYECYSFWIHSSRIDGSNFAHVVDTLDPPTIQFDDVATVIIIPLRGHSSRVVAQSD